MILKSFEVWNFKSIEYSGEIELKDINITIGANNTGKTSLSQVILLLKQTFDKNNIRTPLLLNGPLVSLGQFTDIIFLQDNSKALKFRLNLVDNTPHCKCDECSQIFSKENNFIKHKKEIHNKKVDQDTISKFFIKAIEPQKRSIFFSYFYDTQNKIIKIKDIHLKIIDSKFKVESIHFVFSGNQEVVSEIKSYREKFRAKILINRKIYEYERQDLDSFKNLFDPLDRVFKDKLDPDKIISNNGKLRYELYNPDDSDETIKIDYIFNLKRFETVKREFSLYNFHESIKDELENTISYLKEVLNESNYISSLRQSFPRLNYNKEIDIKTVGNNGEYTLDLIWRDHTYTQELEKEINNWLFKLDLNISIAVKTYDDNNNNFFYVKVREIDKLFDFSNVGFGITQILPIIVECLIVSSDEINTQQYATGHECSHFMINKRIIIIEQPEIHLNPRIQANLADFFIETSDESHPFIIETHSEHIINRLQRRVFENKLNPDKIIIYFFEKIGNKSIITPINIKKNGDFTFWPKNFFQDDYFDAVEMLNHSINKKKRDYD